MSMSYTLNDKGVEVDDLGRERPISVSDLDMKSRMQAQTTGEFPRVLHKPNGQTKRVETPSQRDAALAQGWALAPRQGDGGVILTDESEVNNVVIDFDEAVPEKRKPGRPRKDAA